MLELKFTLVSKRVPGRYGGNFKSLISEHICYGLISSSLLVKLSTGECHRTHAIIIQHWPGNGLVPSGNKSLPGPILIQICVTIWRHFATMSECICDIYDSYWLPNLAVKYIQMLFEKKAGKAICSCSTNSNHIMLRTFAVFKTAGSKTRWFIPLSHDDVIKWKHIPRYWPFVRGIHRSPVNSPHKGQWRGALMFSLICAWLNGWVNNREAGDLRRRRAHYDVTVMYMRLPADQEAVNRGPSIHF